MVRRIDRRRFLSLSGGAIAGTLILVACGNDDDGDNPAPNNPDDASGSDGEVTGRLRLGYFPNVTHVHPNVGVQRGTFAEALGPGVDLQLQEHSTGTTVIEAIFAGELDASYIGPNPAINGFVRSEGERVRILAGATSGGAIVVVRPDAGIRSPADFAGKKIATPSLGNTQDVALRAWLGEHGLASREQGGNVEVMPIANPDALALFQRGEIDGAWAIEPWATRLIVEGGGEVYLDERELWPNGDFVTTHLIVNPGYLRDNREIVERLLRAHVDLTEWINDNPDEAKGTLNDSIEDITTVRIPDEVLDGAWENLRITNDPIANSLQKSADDAYELGYLDSNPDLTEIYDLTLLNAILREKGLEEVEGLG